MVDDQDEKSRTTDRLDPGIRLRNAVTVRTGGDTSRMLIIEVAVRQLVHKAAAGNAKALKVLMDLLQLTGLQAGAEPIPRVITEDDSKV
jgi:hypothetical protein